MIDNPPPSITDCFVFSAENKFSTSGLLRDKSLKHEHEELAIFLFHDV